MWHKKSSPLHPQDRDIDSPPELLLGAETLAAARGLTLNGLVEGMHLLVAG